MFERIAAHAPRTLRVLVVQGEADVHTPARHVRDLEAWNATTGLLDLDVRYHPGAHTGSPEVRRELTRLVLEQVH